MVVGGNLGRDPEVRTTAGGDAVAELRLAVNEKHRDRSGALVERTDWVDVVVWGAQAEACGKYLRKGAYVLAEGRLRREEWEKDGEKRSRIRVQARRVQFMGGRAEGGTRKQEPAPGGAQDDGTAVDPVMEGAAADDLPF